MQLLFKDLSFKVLKPIPNAYYSKFKKKSFQMIKLKDFDILKRKNQSKDCF